MEKAPGKLQGETTLPLYTVQASLTLLWRMQFSQLNNTDSRQA